MRKILLFYFVVMFEIIILVWLIFFNYGRLNIDLNPTDKYASFLEIRKMEHFLKNMKEDDKPLYPGGDIYIQSDNQILIWELRKNYTTKFDGFFIKLPAITTITINSDGFRDREYSLEKLNDTYRIAVVGDSFTFGWGVNDNETFPKVLEKKSNQINNGINYEVLNFGVPGYNTKQEIELLKIKALKYNPDLIIVGYFDNDVRSSKENLELVNLIKEEELQNIKDESLKNQLALIEADKRLAKKYSELPINVSWENVRRSLEELDKIAKHLNISVVIVTFPISDEQAIELENLVNKNGWYLIRTDLILSQYPNNEIVFHELEQHYTPFAYEIVGEEIYNYLVKNQLLPLSIK